MRITQKERIINYIRQFGSITSLEAYKDLGITQLGARIDGLKKEGYTFKTEWESGKNRYGDKITVRGISQQLKNYADKYGLDKKVVYPHSFRHRYAKNFLEKFNDIALLADLMGHESIETTRIYLRRTASEQQALVDKIVTW